MSLTWRCQLLICGVTRHSRIDGLVSVLYRLQQFYVADDNASPILSVMSDTWLACCGHLTKVCV